MALSKKSVIVPEGITMFLLLPDDTTDKDLKEASKALSDAVNEHKEVILIKGMQAIYNSKVWKVTKK